MSVQSETDQKNRAFWDELCGTGLAKHLGISARDAASLTRFDRAYLAMYPYLLERVPVGTFGGLSVLEIGLGYGTLGQQIAQHAAEYTGLDIAQGPVDMMNHRIKEFGARNGYARRGSILDAPFPDETFDAVASIGCYHHTGNLQLALDETWRVLKPGGTAYLMIYNALSYRNWLNNPGTALRAFRGSQSATSAKERSSYDANGAGDAAPETVFTTRRDLRRMCSKFSAYRDGLDNWGGPFRPLLLRTLAPVGGLDIYFAVKK